MKAMKVNDGESEGEGEGDDDRINRDKDERAIEKVCFHDNKHDDTECKKTFFSHLFSVDIS